jgi:hypothetical protein
MKIVVEEITGAWPEDKAICIDIFFTGQELDWIRDGEFVAGETALRKKNVFIGAGLQGFFNKEKKKDGYI